MKVNIEELDRKCYIRINKLTTFDTRAIEQFSINSIDLNEDVYRIWRFFINTVSSVKVDVNDHIFNILITEGSQTQISRGAKFGWKMSPRAEVLDMKGTVGRNMEKYAICSTLIGHIWSFFLYFNDQISNIIGSKESRGPLAVHMRPSGLVFETPGIT